MQGEEGKTGGMGRKEGGMEEELEMKWEGSGEWREGIRSLPCFKRLTDDLIGLHFLV